MMTDLLRRFDVDAAQYRALVAVAIKLDFRTTSDAHVLSTAGGVRRFIASQAMYLLVGLGLGAMALWVPDVFVSGTLILTVVVFLVAASILLEFGVVVIAPLDYDVLGHQPISSATYFLARLTNVFFYTGVLTAVFGVFPIAAYFFTLGFRPLLGLAAIAAFALACTATTLSLVVAYVAVARFVHPQKLRRTLSCVQLLVSSFVFGGYFLMPHLFDAKALGSWHVRKTAWMAAYPPAWFASYLDLAAGRWSALEVIPALASLVTVALLIGFAATRLSLDYADVLSRQASRSEGLRRSVKGRRSALLGRGEHRAVALLMRAQFRDDQRFRLSVLSIVPLTIFYLLMGVRESPLQDPFVRVARGAGSGAFALSFASLFVPVLLLMLVSYSDAFRAAWVFYVTPARRGELVLAAKNLIIWYLLGPYLVCLAFVLGYSFGNLLHAFLHVLVQGLIANLFLTGMVALQPQIPFARPVLRGRSSSRFFLFLLVAAVVQGSASPLLSWAVYPHPAVLAGLIVILASMGVLLERLIRNHVNAVADEMEFLD